MLVNAAAYEMSSTGGYSIYWSIRENLWHAQQWTDMPSSKAFTFTIRGDGIENAWIGSSSSYDTEIINIHQSRQWLNLPPPG
jgi:hypothetical protein